MSRTIWYLSKYAVTPKFGNPTRQYFMSKYLARAGDKVSLIYSRSSMHSYPPQNIKHPLVTMEEGFRQVMLPGPLISLGFSFRRIWSWVRFEIEAKKWIASEKDRPDVVIISSLSILTFLTGIALKKKYGCKLVVEVRDVYPYTLISLGKFSKFNPIIWYLSRIEKQSYKQADLIVSTLDHFQDHLTQVYSQGLNKYLFIPMGYDPEYYQSNSSPQVLTNLNLEGKFVVGYVGTFGKTQATGVIFDAIYSLRTERDIHFILAGDGVEKSSGMEKIVGQSNYVDLGRIKKSFVPAVLEMCDVVLNPWLDIDVYKFGISPNKWMDYMYSGVPIILCYAGESTLIAEAKCGSIIPPQNTNALVNEIYRYKSMNPSMRKAMGEAGKKYLEENLSYKKHAQSLLAALS